MNNIYMFSKFDRKIIFELTPHENLLNRLTKQLKYYFYVIQIIFFNI